MAAPVRWVQVPDASLQNRMTADRPVGDVAPRRKYDVVMAAVVDLKDAPGERQPFPMINVAMDEPFQQGRCHRRIDDASENGHGYCDQRVGEQTDQRDRGGTDAEQGGRHAGDSPPSQSACLANAHVSDLLLQRYVRSAVRVRALWYQFSHRAVSVQMLCKGGTPPPAT